MEIKIAEHAGFCFGVERAINTTVDALISEKEVSIVGDIVHNKQVSERLMTQGLRVYDDPAEVKNGCMVVRSHGLPKSEKEEAISRNIKLIDCTCPILLNIYSKISDYESNGYKVIIIGDKNHPEIKAIVGHSGKDVRVVGNKSEALKIKGENKLYIISQTTNIFEVFSELSGIIEGNNTEVVVANTICGATKARQRACVQLAQNVDAMIVIGGLNSSNTNKLGELASDYCNSVFRIETHEELDFNELFKYNSIGIAAGASTPGWIIEEVVRTMENYSKDEFMEQVEGSFTKISPKDIVKGSIIYVRDDEVSVNINYKSDGIIKPDELSTDPNAKPTDLFQEGQEIEVYVIKLDDGEGNVVLSTRRVEGLKNWQKLLELAEKNEPVTVSVSKEVKGGLLGSVMGITAFLPGSHVSSKFEKDLTQFIGKELDCRIISADDKKRRLVVSRKVIEDEEAQKKLDAVWDTIEVGKVMEGTVARLTEFGAFIDLGGVDGLIHVSDISWNRIRHPEEVLKVGEKINVLVLKKIKDKNRISLGCKQLMKKPFEGFMEENKIGDIVKGTIVNLVEFGAFVRLKEGVEGLVHVSQISDEHVEKPSDELNLGDEVEVKILDINPESKRIALSIKGTKEPVNKPESTARPQREPRQRKERRSHSSNEIEGFKNQELDTSIGALIDFDLSEE